MDHAPPHALPKTDRFEIQHQIGEGAMGFVYRARDRETGLDVALKTLRGSGAGELGRLKTEFRSLADLTHPNLVRLYDLDTTVDPAFFTMELIDGLHFDAFVRSGADPADAQIDYERLADALWQLALGLHALHSAGRYHRDIKPSNVLVEPSGRSVLLDFGLVGSIHARQGHSMGFAGTPAYMAPEQAWGLRETPLSDWFGVGVMLYECLTGRLPFGAAGTAVAGRTPPPPRVLAPATPEVFDALTMALLNPTPEARPAEDALLELLRRGPETASPWLSLRAISPPAEGIVGRRQELAILEDAFAESATRGGVAVRVTGSSGIGKTALIEHVVSEREADGRAIVLRARCRPQETVAFAAVDGIVDELGRCLAEESAGALEALAPVHVEALTRAFPVLASVGFRLNAIEGEATEPAELRRLAFAALRDLLARTASRRPLIVWVDDLQWGDAVSAPILLDLMQEPGCRGLLLLLSYRSDDTERNPLLESVEAQLGARIALGPLTATDTRALVARLLSGAGLGTGDRATEIANESRGSPFFIAELVRSVAAHAREGRISGDGKLTVETVVEEHLARLEPHARRLLEIVVVAGGSISRSIALDAAELGAQGRPRVSTLQQDCLLRERSRGGDPAVEVYHDRIREGVLEQLAPETRRDRHRSLAHTLEARPGADPEALVRHFEGAGELALAGLHAVTAADQAAEALAFERAAALYRKAIDWAPGDEAQLRSLRSRCADALVDGGRCAEAAPLYLEAAAGAPRADALELRRRAVEQLLVSGRIDEGTDELRPLLRELGLRLPHSARTSMLWTAGRLGQIALRRARWRSRAEADVEREDLTRIDLCYSAARGLLAVDTVRGAYLPCLGLLLALRAGEPGRIGRCLSAVGGGVLAPLPRYLSRWGQRMLATARQIAQERGDSYLAGTVEVVSGQQCVVSGDWRGAVHHSAEGIRILEAHGRGARWERNNAHTGLLRGLEELGRLREVTARVEPLREQARRVGDLYGEMTAALFAGITDIAADEPTRARERVRDVLSRWSQRGFHLQHLYALRIEMYADLYEGEPERAWRRLEEAWPAVKRSVLLRVPVTRIDILLLRARTALALAERRSSGASSRLASIRDDATRLSREQRSDARGHAALILAGIAAIKTRPEAAVDQLEIAQREYENAGALLLRACAQHCRARLIGGDEGRMLSQFAGQIALDAGVSDPLRWLRLQAAGLPG